MDPNSQQDCSPEAVIGTLREQARSLRQAATGIYQRADELDAIGDQWEAALGEQGGGMAGNDPAQPPPAPGMRGGPRRR